jgi:polyhydroxyalkanoate synthase subunit PhaC
VLGRAMGFFRPVGGPAPGGDILTIIERVAPRSSFEIGQNAAEIVAPEWDVIGPDTAGIGDALKATLGGAARNPADLMKASIRLSTDLAQIPATVLTSWVKKPTGGAKPPSDRRFADPAWTDNPYFHAVRLAYTAQCEFARSLVGSSGVDARQAAKASLGLSLLLDAIAPTNFLLSNPTAMKRAFDTAGVSVLRGARNLVLDVVQNKGRPRQVDSSAFTVGENLAITPAKVIFRNELMELLQYEPQTDMVHGTPLLCSPPWINKYYIMDLAPERSFIEWAIRHNRTVFAISYRNPTSEMATTSMEDYLVSGPRQALDVISDVTGSPKIDIVGLCLGGALTAITAAYLTQSGDDRVGNVTLLNTMLDYAEPGMLGVFTDEAAVNRLEKEMAKSGGTLEGKSMAGTFDVMRANDLIFNYVVSNWLLGQDPPVFDILAWNDDSTKMPGSMHAFYLRNFYVRNLLAQGQLEIAGQTIDLSSIKSNAYVVSAKNDHIVPWQSAYKTTQLFSGTTRFILSNGGHIAGIVNPPGPKSWYLAAADNPAEAEDWMSSAQRTPESWWLDWARWSTEHAGAMTNPPPMGSAAYPVLGPGPGTYVFT